MLNGINIANLNQYGVRPTQRGRATGLPGQPKAGPVVAPPVDTAFDLGSSLKALGLDPNMFGSGSDAINQTNELDKQIKAVQGNIAAQQKTASGMVDPFAEAQLKLKGQQAQTDSELAALAMNPPVKQPDYQYTPDTPYPVRGSVPIPQRPEAQVNPVASLLAGIGGFIAPQGAAHFGASAIHGAVQRASQTYADSLRTRDMQLQDLDRRHADEVQARNEAIRFAEDNLDRKTRAEFLDAVGKRDYGLAISKIAGQKDAEQLTQQGYGDLTSQARAQADAIAQLQSLQQNKVDLEGQKSAIAKGALESQKLKIGLVESIAKIKDSQAQHEAAAQHNKDMESLNAANHGLNLIPGQDGQLPSFTPTSQSGLSFKDQARIKELDARSAAETARAEAATKNAATLQEYRAAQVKKVLAGKPIDPSKSTPEQRLALAALSGAQKAYLKAQDQRAIYMRTHKSDTLKGDTDYAGLQKAEEDAALQYQQAHKAAVESVGQKYQGKIKGQAIPDATLKAKSDAELFQMLGK